MSQFDWPIAKKKRKVETMVAPHNRRLCGKKNGASSLWLTYIGEK
jgi:hypothetical protein